MSKNIFEELPSRKGTAMQARPQAAPAKSDKEDKESGGSDSDPKDKSLKRIKQAIYDIRYRARREEIPLMQAFADFMKNSKLSPAERNSVKAGLSEDYNIKDLATNSLAESLYRVFVLGEKSNSVDAAEEYLEELKATPERKYHVRVTDKNTNKTYYRYANREKINQLRANPNIKSVEMLDKMAAEYGKPYEGERKQGKQTAAVASGKGLDAVGKEDSDPDNDGKPNDPNDKYIMKRRAAIGAAIEKRKTVSASYEPDGELVDEAKKTKKTKAPRWQDSDRDGKWYEPGEDVRKEDYLWAEGTDSTEGQNKKQITGDKVNNYKGSKPVVTVMPNDPTLRRESVAIKKFIDAINLQEKLIQEKAESEQQQKLFGLALSVKRGETPRSEVSDEVLKIVDTMSEKKIRDFAKTKHEGLPKKVQKEEKENEGSCDSSSTKERDKRGDFAKINLIKNKLRAMGEKNPIVMIASEEVVDEARALGRAGRDADDNPKGAAARVSSGRGMTMTPARGLGASKPKGDDEERKKRHAEQVKKDRRAAARERSEEGEDRLSRLVRSVQNNSYEPKGEVVSEEESDRQRDTEQERGGMDRPSRYAGGRNPNRPAAQTGPKKKPTGTPEDALNSVLASLRAQHGDSAVSGGMRTRKRRQG